MNAHTLTSPSTHWWWPAAAAGTAALVAVGAITVGPALFDDSPAVTDAPPTAPKVSNVTPVRACLSAAAPWNPAIHGRPSGCVQVDPGPGSLSGTSGGTRNPVRELSMP